MGVRQAEAGKRVRPGQKLSRMGGSSACGEKRGRAFPGERPGEARWLIRPATRPGDRSSLPTNWRGREIGPDCWEEGRGFWRAGKKKFL